MKEKHIIKGNATLDKLCGLQLRQERRNGGEEEEGSLPSTSKLLMITKLQKWVMLKMAWL